MKKKFKNIFIGSWLLLTYLIFGLIFNGDHKWMIFLLLITTFSLSFLLFKRSEKGNQIKNFFILVSPLWLLLFITSLFSGFTLSLLYLIFIPISAFLGKVFATTRQLYLPITGIVLFSFVAFLLFPNQIVWSNNQGARVNKDFSQLTLVNENRDTVKLDSDKIIALDFWTTSCGVCFKKFPDYEKVYNDFKNNPEIEMYSVNVPLKRDTFEQTVSLVEKLNYTFPTLYSTSNEETRNLGVQAYPHLIILKNGKIRYSGRLETDKTIIVNNLSSELIRLLDE